MKTMIYKEKKNKYHIEKTIIIDQKNMKMSFLAVLDKIHKERGDWFEIKNAGNKLIITRKGARVYEQN